MEKKSPTDLESTATLIGHIQNGDREARDRLVRKCLPALRRWAHGRLPAYGRALSDTDDLIQTTLMNAMARVEHFRPEREGAFLAYLRQALVNTIRSELRFTARRPQTRPIEDGIPPLGTAVAPPQELVAEIDAYEQALERLPARQRHAVVLRLEFGMSFLEIADELEMASADAARMTVSRSVVRVAEALA